VLEDVEAKDRVEGIGDLEFRGVLAQHLNVGSSCEALLESMREIRIRLDGDDSASSFRGEGREGPDPRAGVKD
jgi:hypothetical protein